MNREAPPGYVSQLGASPNTPPHGHVGTDRKQTYHTILHCGGDMPADSPLLLELINFSEKSRNIYAAAPFLFPSRSHIV